MAKFHKPYRLAEPAPHEVCMGCGKQCWTLFCDACAPPAERRRGPDEGAQPVAVTSSQIRELGF